MSDLTGAELLTEAARKIRDLKDDLEFSEELAGLLDRAAEAFPIDHTEPPRNPKDRRVIMAALFLAGEIVNPATEGEPR